MSDPYVTWDQGLPNASDEPDGWPDLKMIPYVETLRAHQIVTLQSCAGHKGSSEFREFMGDGCLWFQAYLSHSALTQLLACPQIPFVKRMLKPEDCWEIIFTDLVPAMAFLFMALGVPLPHPETQKIVTSYGDRL